MNSRKAQAFMTDFMASIAIFGAILTLFITMWSLGVDSQQSFDREDLLREQAERTADFLVTTEGYPNNWEENGVEVRIPGFATSDNILSTEKIKAFNNLSYERQKQLTKTQNFTLKFRDSESGEILQPEDEDENNPFRIGIDPLNSADTVIAVDRQVAVNRSGELQKAELNYIVWR